MITRDVHAAAAVLRRGGLVALPTETVYGLGADATNAEALARIFSAKGRPVDHPLIVHVPRTEDLTLWAVDIPESAWQLARSFWPGPLTLILKRHPAVLDLVTGGLATVGMRVPAHPMSLALLRDFGGGIAAPSANRFGCVSPTEAAHVAEGLGDAVDLILDGGACDVGVESTIVDLTSGEPMILRPGGVPQQALEEVLNTSVALGPDGSVRCPGLHPVHYAPRARVVVCSSESEMHAAAEGLVSAGSRVAIMSPGSGDSMPSGVTHIPMPSALPDMARELYRSLRLADALQVDAVLTISPPASGLGIAIADRLRRAACAHQPDADDAQKRRSKGVIEG